PADTDLELKGIAQRGRVHQRCPTRQWVPARHWREAATVIVSRLHRHFSQGTRSVTMRLFNRTATRSTDQIASDFGQLIDEGREMLDEFAKKPALAKENLRATLADVSDKLADYQSSATKIARRGARQGTKYARQ